MLWEIEIIPKRHDPEQRRIGEELAVLTHDDRVENPVAQSSRGFLLDADLTRNQVERLVDEVLVDPIAETVRVGRCNTFTQIVPADGAPLQSLASVLLKPGVMDPAALSVADAIRDLGYAFDSVRTFRRYYGPQPITGTVRQNLLERVLANDAIEQVVEGPISTDHLALGSSYEFRLAVVPLRNASEEELTALSRDGQLSLSLAEMKTIQAHFAKMGREPTDVELETIAQTWSEHCSHKTLKGIIDFTYETRDGALEKRRYDNLLRETIFGATQQIRERLGVDDWCVSVFSDNAGIVKFDDHYNVCFKVETHNHPSAIEPYGGANTGIGGVIRDPLGTGMGAKPICNTDVFCFAPPDTSPDDMPPGVLHPKKVMRGVVAGVRDYGNRMGIPTINGAICFDERYIGNPLVYCGTVGLIPVDQCDKQPQPGDWIVAVGGRTGRDGIHGATFSSIELTEKSEKISGGAVQIGNPITEKKLLDVLLTARDRGLYHAITDCGAGGFSSAVGEMGEKIGASVQLEKAPLKYDGLSYTEIWISEAQERMILAVPDEKWDELRALCESEDVEATRLGTFEATGRLRLSYHGEQVADLDMAFLHDGRPDVIRKATWKDQTTIATVPEKLDYADALKKILASYNVCSKEWVIRQYDHEVQGGAVIKPLVGEAEDGPGDASVITPVLASLQGLAVGCGIQPLLGDIDPYAMAAAAFDEAVRNVVAVGADPEFIAVLDNFCWGNTEKPEVLGSLVRAAEACRDMALAYGMPFISGKDSLNNEFRVGDKSIAIPATLLISAMGRIADVRRCVTMDLKSPGNALYMLGETRGDLGGSHLHLMLGVQGGKVPGFDANATRGMYRQLHFAISGGLVRSCHDLSEGGLAVAIAEMAFAGGVGAHITDLRGPSSTVAAAAALFAETPGRLIVEVEPKHVDEFERLISDAVCRRIGSTIVERSLVIVDGDRSTLIDELLGDLKEAWQAPLRW